MYYDPKRGYSGVNQLVKKTRYSKKKVEEFLAKQRVYTLHKPIRHRFKTRRVLVSNIDDQWQADLVDMQKLSKYNKNYNYILTVIDIFSKFAWAIPIKKKTGEEILKAFNIIFKYRRPMKIHTDKGLEFINKPTQNLFQKLGIHWIDIIHDLIFNYNNSYHRSIKMTPVEASLEKNSKSVYDSLFPNEKIGKLKGKFKVGDRVRISKKRKDFTKGYLPNFTEEIFVILKVLETDPPTYILNDMNDEIIKGSFYEQELVKYENDAYEIDKIIKRKKDKLLVKWKGYIEPSWINKSDMM